MNRYQSLEQSATPIKYYLSTIPTKISKEDVPFYYTAVEGDRLDMLATQFYKTPSKWWIIASANNLATGTLTVTAGTQLYIPNL